MDTHINDWKTHLDRIAGLSDLAYNYDAKQYEASADKLGWNIDKHSAAIGRESPGPPSENGPFARAKEAIRSYQFPDPKLISALYDPEQELAGRNMLMKARFAGITFFFGVRITRVIDERKKDESGAEIQAWGYAYRTLKGHFEIGEITFEVWKNLGSGEVSFHIEAYSKPDRIPNLFHRLGFKVFGRPLQRYFSRSSIARMQKIAAGTQSAEIATSVIPRIETSQTRVRR